jgi:hypothetical protein
MQNQLTDAGRKRLWWAVWLILVFATLGAIKGDEDAVTTTTTIDRDTEVEAPARSLEDYWPAGLEVECGLGAAMYNDAREEARKSRDPAEMNRIMDEMNAMGCLG